MDWSKLETPITGAVPEFYVEPFDGRHDWREIARQATFLSIMRMAAPRVLVYANANAGKRAVHVARKEGILAGVFDLICVWRGQVAWVEFKGADGRGRPGKLSDAQVEFGNRVTQLGWPCACFYSPYAAADWLRDQGFPVGGFTDGAR